MASLSGSVFQPNSRGWVGYLTHEKPSAEDEQAIKKARIESPPPPPPTAVTLPNRRGWVDYFTEVDLMSSQPNSRGWVSYLTHEKPSAEDEQPIKKARIESPPPPPSTAVTLPNRRGWVGYFAEVEFPPSALFEAIESAVLSVLYQVHPDCMLSEDAKHMVGQMVRLTCESLVKNLAVGGHTTVTTQEMESAVREVFEGELAMVRCACMAR